MNFVRPLWLVALLAAALLAPATARDGDAVTFPSVTGRDLNGRTLQLPKDFAGEVDLIFVAFAQRQQSDVDSWKTFADAAQKKHRNLKVYELPVLARGMGFMRGFIDGGMRNAIKDDAARAATVTLYIDKTPFKRSLGIANEDQIVTFVIKRDGTVLAKVTGRYDESKAPDLDALLK